MKPNAPEKYNPDPAYLRRVLARTGLSQAAAAERIGISDRLMRCYLAHSASSSSRVAPYPVQFALESLAQGKRK